MSLQIARNNNDRHNHNNNNNNWGQAQQQPPADLVEVYVLFVNQTNRTIDLYWKCDRDTENMYLTLKPNEEVRVNTFSTHSWFFRDYYSGERMHVRSKRLFNPVRIRVPKNPQYPDQLCDVRSQVIIQFPLRKLKENCLWLIVRWLVRTSDDPRETIQNYPIPATLKEQMLSIIMAIEAYSRQAGSRRTHIMGIRR
ncbi:uncharacterized protein Dwil_GK21683 [Drosophila willistoni]|uniref:GK21683 n=1 Tax=Drosophila willistoni TaxID=7260 RepID=B4MPD2_DROWI|nr:protein Vhl [Drosophila willistoni]EDW73971.1 uncharacterized protein Dwil_GK21683 [Drosophila willistoni]